MVDTLISTALPATVLGGIATWGGQAVMAYFKTRNERQGKREDTEAVLEQHRDRLTFDLLNAARQEVAAARAEAAELRPMQARLVHFEEALDHIAALLEAREASDRFAAERRAQQFLTRMRRYGEAIGALKNEAQIEIARTTAATADLDDLARKIP